MDGAALCPGAFGVSSDPRSVHVTAVIPAFRASSTIVSVIDDCLRYADSIVVVDDACPERSGAVAQMTYGMDARVLVVNRASNGGVGSAMKTALSTALQSSTDVIVKIDADGQMDASYIETIRRRFLADPALTFVKGNRFFDSQVLSLMPRARLFGNAALSLLTKIASGYWNVIDPTNGYIAFNAHVLRALPWASFDNGYFFEISVLCELGLKRLPILELEMPTIYTSAPSSLSISRVGIEFPPKLFQYTVRRLLLQYFVFDVNLGSLYFVIGTLLMLFGCVFGCVQWANGIVTHTPKSAGTIMLAALPVFMGFQLVLNALMYDVQFCQKTDHELLVETHRRDRREGLAQS